MNANSVAQNIKENQSWTNDPFDCGFVTGVTPLNHTRNLTDYAIELVSDYGKLSSDQYELTLDMLPDEAQDELVRLYIESIDREIEWACYGDDESMNSEFLCAMLAMLKENTQESREHFAQTTRKNLVIYYKDTLNNLLCEACDTLFHTMMNEAGYRAETDWDNGDVVWKG